MALERSHDRQPREGEKSITTRYTIAGGEWSEAAEILVMGPGQVELRRNHVKL